jgi:hypothetical protein
MTDKRNDRRFESSEVEGVIIGHFAEFKSEMTRAYINKETGEEDGQLCKPPKIRPGVLVQMGDQRVTINVEEMDEKLPYGTPDEKVTVTARKKVLTAIGKRLPYGAEVTVKIRTAIDNGWKRYFLQLPRE